MKKLNGSTFITGLFAVVLCVLLSGVDSLAQNFTNAGNMQNHGTIRLRTASASVINTGTFVNGTATTTGTVEFQAASQTLNNDGATLFDQSFGVIVFNANGSNPQITSTGGTFTTASTSVLRFQGLIPTGHTVFTAVGTNDATRILGTTYYEYAVADNQFVQGVFYEDLTLDAISTKQVLDGVHVSGDYVNATSGARTYFGTFYYDGNVAAAQTITPEAGASGGTNIYAALDLSNGDKTQVVGETVHVGDALTSDGSSPLTVNGTMRIGMDAAPAASALAGTLNIDGAGSAFEVQNTNMAFTGANLTLQNGGATNATFTMNGTGNVDLGGTIAVNTTGGGFIVSDNNVGILTVSGGLSLADAANARLQLGLATQMDITGSYANNHGSGSYVNAQYATSSLVRYLTGGQVIAATGSASANQYGELRTDDGAHTTAGDVYVEANLTVGETAGQGGNLTVGTNTLFMTTPASTITYDATNGTEVVGALRRTVDAVTTSYTMNNENTTIDFTAGGYAGYMEFDVRPQTNPNMYDNTTDVNRKITLEFNNTGWTGTIRAGYKSSDIPGSWAATTTEQNLRYWEASGTQEQKVATGNAVGRNQSDPVRYIELAGITAATLQLPDAGNTTGQFFSTNDLLLRGGPTEFITVSHGRWSNPNTWDEGIQPTSSDDARIRHNVWIGFSRDNMGEGLDGKIDERNARTSNTTVLANQVTIDPPAPLSDGSSLVFGYGTAGTADNEVPSTALPWLFQTGQTLTNDNTALATGFTTFGDSDLSTYRGGSTTAYQGIILLGTQSAMRINSLVNNGAIGVGGVLEIGD